MARGEEEEEEGDVTDSYTEEEVCCCTTAPAVCGGAVQANQCSGWAQSSNSCELILSTEEESWSTGYSLWNMQSNGGSSYLACFEFVLGADWLRSLQGFVSPCKPITWGVSFRKIAGKSGTQAGEDVEDSKDVDSGAK